MASDGKVQYRRPNGGGGDWLLSRMYNYDIDSAVLKPKHLRWLKVVYYLAIVNEGRVRITGQASQTGTDRHNRALARRRAENVKSQLIALSFGQWDLTKLIVGWNGSVNIDRPLGAQGYIFEDERARAVEVEIELTSTGRKLVGGHHTPADFNMPSFSIWHTEWP
ncbi:MAG: OmpA family protein [Pirellulaceae bacterium]